MLKMNHSKNHRKRDHFSPARSQCFRREMELIDGANLNQAPFVNRSCSPKPISKSRNHIESGTLSDTDTDIVDLMGIKSSQFRNGFSKDSFLSSENINITGSKLSNLSSTVNNLNQKRANFPATPTDSHNHQNPSDSTNSSDGSNSIKDGRILPHYEESIIDGFSVIAFEDRTNLELFARLRDEASAEKAVVDAPRGLGREHPPLRRNASRGALNGVAGTRQRRGGGGVSNRGGGTSTRGRKSAAASITAAPTSAVAVHPPTVVDLSASSSNGKEEEVQPRLGPLHVEVSPPSPSSSSATSGVGGKVVAGDLEKALTVEEASFSKAGEEEGDISVVPSPKGSIASISSTTSSSATTKRNLFSIEALTSFETSKKATDGEDEAQLPNRRRFEQPPPPLHFQQMPPHPQAVLTTRINGERMLTSAQWLERLKRCVGPRGFLVPIDELEMSQLTHLLVTDPHFKQEVARLPYVFQTLSNFYAHQQQLQYLHHQHQQQRSAVHQSFLSSHHHPHQGSSRGFPAPATSRNAAGAIPPPPLSAAFPPNFHHSSAVGPSSAAAAAVAAAAAAAMATVATAGVRPPPPPFYSGGNVPSFFASHYPPGHQPPNVVPTYTQQQHSHANPHPHHLLYSSHPQHAPPRGVVPGPPSPPGSFWGARQGTPLYHMAPPQPHQLAQNPNLHVLPRLPPSSSSSTLLGAVDLTSSSSKHVPPAVSHHPPSNRTSMAPPPPPPPSSALRCHPQVPRFVDLFRFDGFCSNRAATGHLRIAYHIMKKNWLFERPFSLARPSWFLDHTLHPKILKPTPQKPPSQLPSIIRPIPVQPRFSNYAQFLRGAAAAAVAAENGLRPGIHHPLPLIPPPPIAIDLTSSPPPNRAKPPPPTRRPLPPAMPPSSTREGDVQLMKRRRLEGAPNGGTASQMPPPHLPTIHAPLPLPPHFHRPP